MESFLNSLNFMYGILLVLAGAFSIWWWLLGGKQGISVKEVLGMRISQKKEVPNNNPVAEQAQTAEDKISGKGNEDDVPVI